MPKRAAVIKKIEKAAKARDMTFDFRRRGGNHDIYDLDGLMIPIERHRELTNKYAERIYRECQPRLGKSWWR